VKGNKEHSECLGYLCDCEEFYTDEPRFDKSAIYEKLLEGVLFRPYFIDLELVHIFVFKIAKSKNNQ
ncbi:8913_t:CDS:2, partial [Funneliformis mosseae]